MQQFRVFLLVSFSMFLFLPSHAQQILQSVTTPLSPTECDSVQVTIQGQLPQNNEIKKRQIQQSGNSTEIILTYGPGSTSPLPVPTFFETINLAPLPAGQNQISVILQDGNGINADNTSRSIQVSPLNLTSGFTLPRDTICEQTTLPITDTSSNADQYIWKDNGMNFDTVASPAYQAADTGKHTIQQIVVNGVCKDTMAKRVAVLTKPVAELGTNKDTLQICENDVDTLAINDGYDQYKWQRNGSVLTGQNSARLPVSDGGLYQVNTRTSNGCRDSDSLFVEEITTTTPSITKTDSVLSSSPATSYQWLRDGNPISGATNSEYIAQQSGAYRVVTFAQSGCSDTSAPTTVVLTGIRDQQSDKKLVTYPSPAQEMLHYKLETIDQQQNVFLSLHDLNGRTVREQHLSLSSQKGIIEVDALANGLYLLQLQTDKATITKKVVIE
jgi:hypothetical protein